jgi:hypothetical protein
MVTVRRFGPVPPESEIVSVQSANAKVAVLNAMTETKPQISHLTIDI